MTSAAAPNTPLSATAAETAATAAARATRCAIGGKLPTGTDLRSEKQQKTLEAESNAQEAHFKVELAPCTRLIIEWAPALIPTGPSAAP
ncbi:hypothetical protein [Sinomonas mesophila]|uniref:hypothetical protein n=1 Tax=Sinomonas mesophila TaxID=1531955 RepID=UPI000984798E|nr:hypothetical protein [Sinomonas mesophila]